MSVPGLRTSTTAATTSATPWRPWTRCCDDPRRAASLSGPQPSPLPWSFEEYWRFHLDHEHQRLYPSTAQGEYALGA
jgi:hypothetical protein